MRLEDIFRIEDAENFVVELNNYICEKCSYGDDMGALSPAERTFYIAQSLEMEVNNGGFSQFFYNSSGDFAAELVKTFREIGAEKTAAICEKALAAHGRPLPEDREERMELLDELESDELDQILGECDDAFYEYEDDLSALNRAYVLKNRAQFA